MLQGNYTNALKYFLEAEKLAPTDHILQKNLGETYIERKMYDKAIVHLNKAVELKPDYSTARNSLGKAYILSKDYDKAISTLRSLTEDEAFAIYATPHFPRNNLGWAYYYSGKYTLAEASFLEAYKVYEDGLPIDMTYLSVLRGLGLTYLALDQPDDAILHIEKAIATAPNVQDLHMDLARAYRAKGNNRQAALHYRTVIELDPASPIAAEAQEELQQLKP